MKKECDTCGGSGQISYFKGVSRFLLSVEDCDVGNGVGYTNGEEDIKKGQEKKKKNIGRHI